MTSYYEVMLKNLKKLKQVEYSLKKFNHTKLSKDVSNIIYNLSQQIKQLESYR